MEDLLAIGYIYKIYMLAPMETVQPFHVYVDLAPLFLCASHPASGVTGTRST